MVQNTQRPFPFLSKFSKKAPFSSMFYEFYSLDPGPSCLQEVLDFVSNEIGPQRTKLLSRLHIMANSEVDVADALKIVSWRRLLKELERLERMDIVEHITKNTLITEGISNLMKTF